MYAGVLFGEQAVLEGELSHSINQWISGDLMRKKFAALLVIHLAALSFTAYPYVAMATFDAPESSQNASYSPTPLPPTQTPTPEAGTATKDPQITVTFNHWDPHDIAIPTKIEIISPGSDSLPEGYVYLMVGISSSKWLINGVFCTQTGSAAPVDLVL